MDLSLQWSLLDVRRLHKTTYRDRMQSACEVPKLLFWLREVRAESHGRAANRAVQKPLWQPDQLPDTGQWLELEKWKVLLQGDFVSPNQELKRVTDHAQISEILPYLFAKSSSHSSVAAVTLVLIRLSIGKTTPEFQSLSGGPTLSNQQLCTPCSLLLPSLHTPRQVPASAQHQWQLLAPPKHCLGTCRQTASTSPAGRQQHQFSIHFIEDLGSG